MVEIFLIKNDTNGEELYRFRITNFSNAGIIPVWPVTPMPLPEEGSDQNVLVKLTGNTLKCNVSWTLKDYSTNQEITKGITTKTVQQQINFFNNLFQAQSIEDSFRIVYNYPDDPIFYDGFITGVTFTTTQPNVLSWTARVTFFQGKVIAMYNIDTPSAPLSVTLSNPEPGSLRVNWTAPIDTGTNEITGYRVLYALSGGNFLKEDVDDLIFTKTISSLTPGPYKVRVMAKSSIGFGTRSVVEELTVT